MSEFTPSSTNSHFSTLFSSNLINFCSSILSNPLYLSYFIYFSPHLFKLLSFLSPLFLTTSLLLLATATTTTTTQASFLTRNDELHFLEEIQGYIIILEDHPVGETVQDLVGFESLDQTSGEKEVEPPGVAIDKVEDKQIDMSGIGSGSEEVMNDTDKVCDTLVKVSVDDLGDDFSEKVSENLEMLEDDKWKSYCNCNYEKCKTQSFDEDVKYIDNNSQVFGSMRKVEKEYRRTLACKLFEERHNGDGGDGMDSLWEKYEMDMVKPKAKNIVAKKRMKSKVLKYEEEDVEEEQEEEMHGKLCCLQALKFSTAKMNLGMKRSIKLVRISKAFKGMGWLHHASKNGKRNHSLSV